MSRKVLGNVAQYMLTSNITKLIRHLMCNTMSNTTWEAAECSGQGEESRARLPWFTLEFY